MDRGFVLGQNVARAEAFAKQFKKIKVGTVGTIKDASAIAAHHNGETGWGFTAQFVTSADGKNHVHAWVEFVGPAEKATDVVRKFKKIVGG